MVLIDKGVNCLLTILHMYEVTEYMLHTLFSDSQAARHLYPALTVQVFFSLDFIYLVSLHRISGGYQEDIL